jgi:tRNA(Arg) A34 adenosine deaminase TadA/ADP-ribose pyrophosphatase YjhB (NUDIX family)
MDMPHVISTLLYGFNERGEVLLLRRGQEPNLGLWSPPGGKLETATGESPYACACREAAEELGLALGPGDLHLTGLVTEHGYEGTAHWLMFLFEIKPRLTRRPDPIREGVFEFFATAELEQLALPETDREQIWPLFWRHRGGFFAAHCRVEPDGRRVWTMEAPGVLSEAGREEGHASDRAREVGPGVERGELAPVEPIIDLQSDLYFMGEALRQARRAYAAGEVPVGAVVVREGRIIARAYNQVELLKDATAHAEMLALTQAEEVVGDWRLTGCTLYVTKEPCPMCAGAAVHTRLARIVYGVPDVKGGAAGGAMNLAQWPTLNHRCEVTGGVRADEGRLLLKDFFVELRNTEAGSGAD